MFIKWHISSRILNIRFALVVTNLFSRKQGNKDIAYLDCSFCWENVTILTKTWASNHAYNTFLKVVFVSLQRRRFANTFAWYNKLFLSNLHKNKVKIWLVWRNKNWKCLIFVYACFFLLCYKWIAMFLYKKKALKYHVGRVVTF